MLKDFNNPPNPESSSDEETSGDEEDDEDEENDTLASIAEALPKKRGPGRPPKNNTKVLAWKCHKCARHNELSRLKCPVCMAVKGQSYSSTRTSTEGCEIVEGVERHGDECVVCGYGGGEFVVVVCLCFFVGRIFR